MLVSWIVFPIVMLAVSAGCGLAVQRASGEAIARPLVLPVGFAAMIVVASSATAANVTATFAAPLVLALAVVGFLVAKDRRAWVPDRWAALAAAGVYVVFAAPSAFTGGSTFTGYIQLDDIATWLALTDQVMHHGRDISSLAPSTHQATLASYLPGGYPVGAFLPLGLGHEFTFGRDIAWLFAPTMALTSGLLALTITEIVSTVLSRPWARALVGFVAAQPALLTAYAEWGAIKEVTAALLVALVAALAPTVAKALAPAPERGETPALEQADALRGLLPLVVAIAAIIAALSVGAGVWVVPVVLVALVAARVTPKAVLIATPVMIGAVALLSIPSLLLVKVFLIPQTKSGSVLTLPTELGNLRGPLQFSHILGIWPAGDFRTTPVHSGVTNVLLVLLVIAGIAGVGLAVFRRAGALAGYASGGVLACALLVDRGSPWVDAKAMATASPMVLTAALAALVWVATEQRPAWVRGPAFAAFGLFGAAVLWSNVLGYGASYPAPREQLRELEAAGHMLAGQGPTLMNEYEPYGARHFLRDADAESASELRARLIPLRNGEGLPKSAAADVDAFDPAALRVYRSLVLRTGPTTSRPPSIYRRVEAGATYDVWQRPEPVGPVPVADQPLDGDGDPGANAPCATVRSLAAQAGASGRLVAVSRTAPVQLKLSTATLSGGLAPSSDPHVVTPLENGSLEATVTVPKSADYAIWLGGSTRGRTTVTIDGKQTGSIRGRLNNQGGSMRFGHIALAAGSHRVELTYTDDGLAPGQRGQQSQPLALGPLLLAPPEPDPLPTFSTPVAQASTLCGRHLDWIEAFAG